MADVVVLFLDGIADTSSGDDGIVSGKALCQQTDRPCRVFQPVNKDIAIIHAILDGDLFFSDSVADVMVEGEQGFQILEDRAVTGRGEILFLEDLIVSVAEICRLGRRARSARADGDLICFLELVQKVLIERIDGVVLI